MDRLLFEREKNVTWKELEKQLNLQYGDCMNTAEAKRELEGIKQGNCETLAKLASRVHELAKVVFQDEKQIETSEVQAQLAQYFIDALRK